VASVLLLFAVLGGNLKAQIIGSGPGPAPAGTDHGQYTLTGTVVNSVTGEPISRALVQINGMAQQSAFTSGDGHFQFEGLNAGVVMFNVRKPGFFNENEVSPGRYRGASVQVGPNTEPVVVKLVPEAIVYGRVVDADGEPMENARIEARTISIVNGRKEPQQRRGGSTNEDGEFRIAGLTPGPYYIAVVPIRNPNRLITDNAKGQEMGYHSIVYWPNAPDAASAGQVELTPGQRVQLDFSLKREPVFRVSGTVTGTTPGQSAAVQFMDASGESHGFGASVNPQTGKFEVRSVPAGTYLLRAGGGDARGQLSAEVPLTVAANVEDIHLVLQPAISITVNVQTIFSHPTPQNAGLQQRPDFPLVMVNLRPAQAMRGGASSSFDGPQGNRTYAVRNVNPGRYSVEFNPNGNWYVQSATCGTVDLLHDELVVMPGGQAQPIEIVLRDDTSRLSFSVSSDGRDALANVLVVSQSSPMERAKSIMVQLGNHSETSMDNFAPGDYNVYAFDRVDGIEYANPEVMRKYSSQAAHVTLTPNGKASVNLTLIHTGD